MYVRIFKVSRGKAILMCERTQKCQELNLGIAFYTATQSTLTFLKKMLKYFLNKPIELVF